ncbi:hypothetical protein BYT27DRAFT_7228131 [Phlegmacium glaucopus]|nr:hypothetical protein BYT27DRAFT_7228131 [Phlegmacium glaucopus]
MKRTVLTLVSYSSSEEDSEPVQVPQTKKRKLPPISSSISPPAPIDNPELHQGRIRTTPHVEGQFAAHVYVSLPLGRQSLLYKLIQEIFLDAKAAVPTLREIWPDSNGCQRPELHISLSRPIFLRAHQREELKRSVKNIAIAQKPFILSFATLSEMINDEKTRTFLTMEVGAGHHELRSLAGALAPALRAIRQQEYYVNPRFHASIAWALLSRPQGTLSLESNSDGICTPSAQSENSIFPPLGDSAEVLPPELITSLIERYSARLSSPYIGVFDVEKVVVKIGKEITSWRLLGM